MQLNLINLDLEENPIKTSLHLMILKIKEGVKVGRPHFSYPKILSHRKPPVYWISGYQKK